MTRQSRLEQYADPTRGPHGAGRDQKNLDYWSDRASENSRVAPRARDGEIDLPSTKVRQRDTSMRPYERKVDSDARRAAKADKADVGSTFYPGVRRIT